MKKIAILTVLAVPEDTTDEQIAQVVASVSAQVDDPVGGYDESGNEQVIPGTSNRVVLFPPDEATALLMAAHVGLEGASAELHGADAAWTLLEAADSL